LLVWLVGSGAASPAAACDALSIPTVAIERCVVAGDQPEIDQGHVVRVDRLSTPTVHWLVGHRTTYGATFRALPDVSVGDVVAYRGHDYVLVEYTTARFDNPGAVLTWIDSAAPTIVLQTSRDRAFAHLWRGIEITASTPPPPSHAPQPSELVIETPSVRSHQMEATHITAVDASQLATSPPPADSHHGHRTTTTPPRSSSPTSSSTSSRPTRESILRQ
jgi:hypothetical protein